MIECKELVFGYSKSLLFDNLKANFESGHIYGLLGKNGAGKTTLLKCMTGLLHLQKGEINIYGKNPIKRDPQILQNIFFFPENFFLPPFTVKKYCDLYKDFYPDFNEEYFYKTCNEFEIPLDKNLLTLSFGQKKKFYLAFGLSTFSKIMLLDEPTNGLDIPSKTMVRKKIAESLLEDQIFIISTHQVRDLSQLFDSIIILHEGKITLNKPMDFINQNFSMIEQYKSNNGNSDSITNSIDNDSVIYYEDTATSRIFLIKENNDKNTVDLEFFFNAVISNPSKFLELQ